MLIILLAFGMFSFVGCKTKQATSEDIKCINENHYFYTGASPEEIGKQIYKNFFLTSSLKKTKHYNSLINNIL